MASASGSQTAIKWPCLTAQLTQLHRFPFAAPVQFARGRQLGGQLALSVLTSWSSFSSFSCSSAKYMDVTRPLWDLSRQSLTSSTNWCWMKPSTPSANGREFSGEQWVIISNKRSSIWAVACKHKNHTWRGKKKSKTRTLSFTLRNAHNNVSDWICMQMLN